MHACTDMQHNPFVPFAATLAHMTPGMRLLFVNFGEPTQVTKLTVDQAPAYIASMNAYCLYPAQCPSWYLGDMGVCAQNAQLNRWSHTTVTIVNNWINRQELYDWLIRRGGRNDLQAAGAIAMLYPRVTAGASLQRAS